jgi:hypothetical protein
MTGEDHLARGAFADRFLDSIVTNTLRNAGHAMLIC